jgi:hypothetical protein
VFEGEFEGLGGLSYLSRSYASDMVVVVVVMESGGAGSLWVVLVCRGRVLCSGCAFLLCSSDRLRLGVRFV